MIYPLAGMLAPGTPISWQRDDQGQDLVIPWRTVLHAPGDGHCVSNGSDAPFPNGFGPSYARVAYTSGPFAGHIMYYGHCTSLLRPGQQVSFGVPVAIADQGHPHDIGVFPSDPPGNGGWVEFGETFPDGSCGPMASSHWFDPLLRESVAHTVLPYVFGDEGWAIVGMTAELADCGYLPHFKNKFDQSVHGAVKAFRIKHGLSPKQDVKGHDHGVCDQKCATLLKQRSDWCRQHRRKEYP